MFFTCKCFLNNVFRHGDLQEEMYMEQHQVTWTKHILIWFVG
jgi:hypothetical protein